MKSIPRDVLLRKLSELEKERQNYIIYWMRKDVIDSIEWKIELLKDLLY